MTVLEPGQSSVYHAEANQEAFLVLAGECRLLVEGEERLLRAWDFFHSPPWTEHAFVGAGDAPCVVLMVGAHVSPEVRYPVSDLAARYGASVEKETCRSGAGICDGRAFPATAAVVLVTAALGLESFAVAVRRHSRTLAQASVRCPGCGETRPITGRQARLISVGGAGANAHCALCRTSFPIHVGAAEGAWALATWQAWSPREQAEVAVAFAARNEKARSARRPIRSAPATSAPQSQGKSTARQAATSPSCSCAAAEWAKRPGGTPDIFARSFTKCTATATSSGCPGRDDNKMPLQDALSFAANALPASVESPTTTATTAITATRRMIDLPWSESTRDYANALSRKATFSSLRTRNERGGLKMFEINEAALVALLESHEGLVGRLVEQKSQEVTAAAQRNAATIMHRYPEVVSANRLRAARHRGRGRHPRRRLDQRVPRRKSCP